MSTRMLPRGSIDVLRDYVDIALDAIGMDCTLYIPTNTSYIEAEKLDVFAKPSDYNYTSYSAKTFINWSPKVRILKKLGLFTEDQLPILARFGNKAVALEGPNKGLKVSIDTMLHSYIKIEPEFISEKYVGIEEFEIVDVASQGFQDAVIRRIYSLVPRRVQT